MSLPAKSVSRKPVSGPRAVKIKRALISVSAKDGLIDFSKKLAGYGVEILSTGGTAKTLKEAGLKVKDVSEHTGFPEIMDGRVKTLHPKIHGGILSVRDNDAHKRAQSDHDIGDIDLVVVNLYPFAQTVASDADFETCIENIDIGGPALIRAAAKNHAFVTVVTDAEDYEAVLKDMEAHSGATTYALRKKLAAQAYAMTAAYDSAIAAWFNRQPDAGGFPRRISFAGSLKQELRYGENPHQQAALYMVDDSRRPGAARASMLQGKELSYNNLNDTDAAFELVAEFEDPAVAIIKHANPCGVAVADNVLDAYERALACDPVSAFGGIIALNRTLTAKAAKRIIETFCEVIIAPDIEVEAANILKAKDKIRVLTTGAMPDVTEPRRKVTCIAGGLLVQDGDTGVVARENLKVVSEREPTDQELEDMLFAFKIAKHVKSNAIVYARDLAAVGIGAGQMSRLDSSRIAALKMKEAGLHPHPIPLPEGERDRPPSKKGERSGEGLRRTLVVASDAFFPFADGLIAAAEAGVTAVIQPGGSIRDEEVIKAADERGLAMVFTGMRHFRH